MPNREQIRINNFKLNSQRVLLQQPETNRFGKYGILIGFGVLLSFENDLKFEIEVYWSAIEIIVSLHLFFSQNNVVIREEHMYLCVFIIVDPKGGVQREHIFLYAIDNIGVNRVEDRG